MQPRDFASGKKVPRASVIGDRGVARTIDQALKIGFLFHETRPTEVGVDGYMEWVDPATGSGTGLTVAVQIKTTEKKIYDAETDVSFKWTAKEADYAYWAQSNLPVILLLIRLSDDTIYWKEIVDPQAGGNRQLSVLKAKDGFDQAAAETIAQLAVDRSRPGVFLPPVPEGESFWINLLKIDLPSRIWVAPRRVIEKTSAINMMMRRGKGVHEDFAFISGRRIISFRALDEGPFSAIVEAGAAEEVETTAFSLTDDPAERGGFIELLRRTLQEQFAGQLEWREDRKVLFFVNAGGVDRSYRYRTLTGRKQSRKVVAKIEAAKEAVKHIGFRPNFFRFGDDWFLAVEPDYVFTHDGSKPHKWEDLWISKTKRLDKSQSVSGQFGAWAHFLVDGDLFQGAGKGPLRFSRPIELKSGFKVPEDTWITREDQDLDDPDEAEVDEARPAGVKKAAGGSLQMALDLEGTR
ncbi:MULTISPECIES: DUF4365 domain-containing protein [unclassified Aureimonas]|uniref:DUF4365 domain-containing protein n=1 Tax=unclassified Aureimonas TaxID=2615206 RepID=UPI0006FDC85C|nr:MULTISPECIES: DUF4365 domain-containing protein [unclassified Aureimonas]KQT62270.1 hypothetical protein ASG62_23335 [Aureimonas sp. Leaf427]KQT72494.1 hypothetical protein ASG54_18230 [Aureimonas sp. Leaf460]